MPATEVTAGDLSSAGEACGQVSKEAGRRPIIGTTAVRARARLGGAADEDFTEDTLNGHEDQPFTSSGGTALYVDEHGGKATFFFGCCPQLGFGLGIHTRPDTWLRVENGVLPLARFLVEGAVELYRGQMGEGGAERLAALEKVQEAFAVLADIKAREAEGHESAPDAR